MHANQRIAGQHRINAREQVFQACSGRCGRKRFLFVVPIRTLKIGKLHGINLIDFVEDVDAGRILYAQIIENLFNFGVLLGVMRIGNISDMQDKCRLLHFFERLTMIEVTVDLKKEAKLVEFLVQAEHKHDFVARESNTDVMAAVDVALDKLALQLRRYKEKIQDHRRTPSTGRVAGAPTLEESGEE